MNPVDSSAAANPLALRLLSRDAGLLAAALLIAAFPIGWFAWQAHGSLGVESTAVAGAVCLGAALLSLLVARVLHDPAQAMSAMVLGMGVRMGLPMMFGVLLTQSNHRWASAGLFMQIVLFYLVGLCVETALRVGQLKRRGVDNATPSLPQEEAAV